MNNLSIVRIICNCVISFIFLLTFFQIEAQKYELLADTIYTNIIDLKTQTILYNSENSIVVNKAGISPFHKIESHVLAYLQNEYLVKIDGYAYILNEDLSINFDAGLPLDFKELSKLRSRCAFAGNTIAYYQHDSVFVDNFVSPNKTFVLSFAEHGINNENYLILEKGYPEEKYVYNIQNQKINRLPQGHGSIEHQNSYFVIKSLFTLDSGYKVDVFDVHLNKIVDQKEGYQKYVANKDLLAVFEGKKPPKFWYKKKSIKLPSSVTYFELIDETNYCVVKNKNDKFGIMGPTGKIILPLVYDMLNPNYLFSKVILAKKGNKSYIFDRNGKELFKGKYDRAFYLCPDRFKVHSKKGTAIVNTKGDIIIPFMRERNSRLYYSNKYGKANFYWISDKRKAIFTVDGELIVEIEHNGLSSSTIFESLVDEIHLDILRSLTDQQVAQINPSDLWLKSKKNSGKFLYCLENHTGDRLTKWFNYSKHVKSTGMYIVKTNSDKYGVLGPKK